MDDVDTIALIMQQGFPGVGFAISAAYPGETAYDKLTMAKGQVKPTLDEIIAKALELNIG